MKQIEMNFLKSKSFFDRAKQLMPGGVNSPVRAFGAVGGTPPFIAKAKGAKIYDVDGNEYIDYLGSWGPMILGHANNAVVRAIQNAAARGTSYGAPTELEMKLADLIIQAIPSIEKVRFVNSGTEATMSAIRLARAFTKKDKILKFAGCYHGHSDFLLVRAGSGIATLGLPDSPGVPANVVSNTLTAPFNDLNAVERLFQKFPEDIAAIIVEPIAGNMGVILPAPGFLSGLKEICQNYESLLIFDEVITGFRVHFGGAQTLYDIKPDITCLGKIIGGGLPVGAYGGRAEIMSWVAPEGPVYQAGTLSGNPLAMAAGIATLQELKRDGVYQELDRLAGQLSEGLSAAAAESSIPVQLNRAGSMMSLFFTDQPVTNYTTAKRSQTDSYRQYFHRMLQAGHYFAPSQFESAFVSFAHTPDDIHKTLDAARGALAAIETNLRA